MDSSAFSYSGWWAIWPAVIAAIVMAVVMFGAGVLVGWWLL